MGKILGIAIKNYGSLKDIKMGQLYSGQTGVPLGNMVAIIGPSGNGKSTLADAFGFIADALTTDVESACDASNRGGYDKLVSQGSNGPIHFEIYYKENSNPRQLVFIEEPENGLYHQYLADLAIEMSKNVGTGYNKQLFVTTHSPFFVNALSPEQVWVLDKGADGFSTIKRSSEYDFVSDLVQEGAYIGDLWNDKYFG